jgi:hypothetical protein
LDHPGQQPGAVRAALPFYLKERGIPRQPLAPLTGSDALKPGEFDAEGLTIRFLEAVTREAKDARSLLWTMEREWRAARAVVSRRLGNRSTSRLPQGIDVLATSPLLSVSALARALGCTVEGASGMLDEVARLEVVAEVTGMIGPAPVWAPAPGPHACGNHRHPPALQRRTTGRPRKVLVPPFAELPVEP